MTDRVKNQTAWPADIVIIACWLMVTMGFVYLYGLVLFLSQSHGVFSGKGLLAGSDFINVWSAAQLTLNGQVMTLFDIPAYRHAQEVLLGHKILDFYNWSYPPHLLPLILVFGLFSYPVGLVVWLGIAFAFYAFAVAAKRPQPWGLGLLLALAPASLENMECGQNGFLSAALMVGGLRLLDKRPVLAGILFGCLSYKPQIGVLIPVALIAARQWRTLLSASLTVAALVGFSIFLFGLDPWVAYFAKTVPMMNRIMDIDAHEKVKYIHMMPTPFMAARLWDASLDLAYGISGALMLASVAVVVYVFRRPVPADLRNAVLLTATFLASPYLFNYDMTLLSAALIMTVAALGPSIKLRSMILISVLWLSPVLILIFNTYHAPIVPLLVTALLTLQLSHVPKGSGRAT